MNNFSGGFLKGELVLRPDMNYKLDGSHPSYIKFEPELPTGWTEEPGAVKVDNRPV
jgi:hypothetical protein